MRNRLAALAMAPIIILSANSGCGAPAKPKPTPTKVKTYGPCKRLNSLLRANGYLHRCELVRGKRQWVRISDKPSPS